MKDKVVLWSEGIWSNEPKAYEYADKNLIVMAEEGSDYWVKTLYGFERDSGHSLLAPWDKERAVEVSFKLDSFTELYDQAGLMIWHHSKQWVKAGIEINDGIPCLAVVVTNEFSDWSLSPVPEGINKEVTIRASCIEDAVIIRARIEEGEWRTIRVARFVASELQAGPFVCSPTRSGLEVTFTKWVTREADQDIHTDPSN
ncbi:DUF1349 domain-containing protein [Paenibacillus sp. Marseille-Q4541]|uniref:DUF1349 domain-containing protein n=1 Tax=Paenibacillus sp. Marseille-Q4541 TaxID=2831522 RepID=UPI001BA8125E|nr:DUF1349 domain-containing protein [Paenibacillus sp. Marseille-Q4541]